MPRRSQVASARVAFCRKLALQCLLSPAAIGIVLLIGPPGRLLADSDDITSEQTATDNMFQRFAPMRERYSESFSLPPNQTEGPSPRPPQHGGDAEFAPMGFVQSWPRNDFATKPPACFFGGNCLKTRDYVIEVQIRPYGKIKAWVRGRHDRNETIDFTRVLLNASLRSTDGAQNKVDLRWDPAKQLFVGYLPGKRQPAAGPLRMQLRYQNKTQSDSILASVTPHAAYGGMVIAAGPYVFEVIPYADGSIEAYRVDPGSAQDSSKLRTEVVVLSAENRPLLIPLNYSKKHQMFLGQAPVGERLGVGPVELAVQATGHDHQGSVVVAKPLASRTSTGWNVIVGPFTVTLAKVAPAKIIGVVRDRKDRRPSSATVALELDIHEDEEGDDVTQIYSVSMRWKAETSRFEADWPATLNKARWIKVKIQEVNVEYSRISDVKWRGSVRI